VTAYRLISAEKARTPVSVSCRLLGVSRSCYAKWGRFSRAGPLQAVAPNAARNVELLGDAATRRKPGGIWQRPVLRSGAQLPLEQVTRGCRGTHGSALSVTHWVPGVCVG
jgi:hypothetical protein